MANRRLGYLKAELGLSEAVQQHSDINTQWETTNMAGTEREFPTGATRDLDQDKLDFEGFLSPVVLKRYARYMHKNRKRVGSDELRASDNWQLGIPRDAYVKSLLRHQLDVWLHHDGRPDLAEEDLETALCAVMFNAMGLLHEVLRELAQRDPDQWDFGGAGLDDEPRPPRGNGHL
jgi:hypothetical protein